MCRPLMVDALVRSRSLNRFDAAVNSASTNGNECQGSDANESSGSRLENVVKHCVMNMNNKDYSRR